MHKPIPIDIIGGAYAGRSRNNIQELINMYVDYDLTGGEDKVELRGTPGLTEWFDAAVADEIRGFNIFQGQLWVVIGDTLYYINGPSAAGGVKTSKGTLATSAGRVQIHNNGTVLALCDGQHVYSQSGTTLTSQRIASYLAYQDGWFIAILPNTASALCTTDPTSWGGAPDIAAEGDPDFLVAAISNYKHVHLIGTKSIEVKYNTGSAVLPFGKMAGGLISTGCIAKDSVVNMNDQIYFLDDDYNVRRIVGLQAEILSTPAIQHQISQLEDQQEAVAYSYSIEGHYIYVITFDESGVTYCFDSTMKLWYKWSTGGYRNRHTSNCFIRYAGKNLVGDYSNGIIYEIDPASRTDNGTAIYRERITQYVTNKPSPTFFNKLILDIQTATEPGSEPEIMLDFSDDYGKTWEGYQVASLGSAGQYNLPVEFSALGSSSSRAWRIRTTDNCFMAMQNAQLIGGIGWY